MKQLVIEQLPIHKEEKKGNLFYTLIYKNQNQIIDQNVKPKTIKFYKTI